MRGCRLRNALACVAVTVATAVLLALGATAGTVQDFLATLPAAQQQEFSAWRAAKQRHDRQLDAYWEEIEKKRSGRRAKRGSSKFFDTEDYVWTYPPAYDGPRLSAELDRL